MDAYVDGSFRMKTIGWGYVLVQDDKPVYAEHGAISSFPESRNITGECYSVIKLLEYCNINNIKSVHITYDYMGLEKWAKGEWQCKTAISKWYRDSYNTLVMEKGITVTWNKVKGHTGNKWNEVADKVAKTGVFVT